MDLSFDDSDTEEDHRVGPKHVDKDGLAIATFVKLSGISEFPDGFRSRVTLIVASETEAIQDLKHFEIQNKIQQLELRRSRFKEFIVGNDVRKQFQMTFDYNIHIRSSRELGYFYPSIRVYEMRIFPKVKDMKCVDGCSFDHAGIGKLTGKPPLEKNPVNVNSRNIKLRSNNINEGAISVEILIRDYSINKLFRLLIPLMLFGSVNLLLSDKVEYDVYLQISSSLFISLVFIYDDLIDSDTTFTLVISMISVICLLSMLFLNQFESFKYVFLIPVLIIILLLPINELIFEKF